MKLDDLKSEANQDLQLDEHLLDDESLRTISLQGKWLDILNEEELYLIKLRTDFSKEKTFKVRYYKGKLTKQELDQRGMKQFLENLTNTEQGLYLDSDEELSVLRQRLQFQEKKVEYVKSVLDAIRQRTWGIKNAIEYRKFIKGT